MAGNEIRIFEKEEFGSIRVIDINGEPWFLAKDVCKCLGTETRDLPDLLDHDEQRSIVDIIHSFNDSNGLRKDNRIISEPGLYSLILRSRKPEAKEFKRWITHDVLPSIRKHGLYAKEDVINRILDDPDFGISLLQEYKFERQKRELAERQRDEAIRINCVVTKKVEKLEDQIGFGTNYKCVKGISWLRDYFNIKLDGVYLAIGKKLSKISRNMDYEIEKIEDSKYGQVNGYHVDVIKEFKKALDSDLNMLNAYRIRRRLRRGRR